VSPALRRDCEAALHVVTADGEVLRGATALVFIYEKLGYTAATLGRHRPLIWGLDAGYALVANNRRFFSRFLFRRE